MALDFQLIKDSNGATATSQYGFSWRVLFLGPVPALLQRDYRFFWGVSCLVVGACVFEFFMSRSWTWILADYLVVTLGWAFVYNELRTLVLIHDGFRISGPPEIQAALDPRLAAIDQGRRRRFLRERASIFMMIGLTIVQVAAWNMGERGGLEDFPAPTPAAPTPPPPTPPPPMPAPTPAPPVIKVPTTRVTVPPDSTANSSEPLPQPTPVRPTFRTYDNRDIDGTDFDTKTPVAFDECSSMCSLNSQCQAFSYDKWNRYCFLKSNISATRLDPKSTSGVRSDVTTPPGSSLPVVMARYRNKSFRGSGYRALQGTQFETCQSTCQQDSSCVAFSFHKHELTCDLYQTTGVYFADSNTESGVKTQSP